MRTRHSLSRTTAFAALLLVLFGVAPTLAVEKGQTSYTAEAVCAFRSIAALDPDPKTRNPDTLAKHFVNPEMVGRFPGLGLAFEPAKVAIDTMDNGVFYYVNARTHHMDRLLTKALDEGVTQVVIMGAGFDSRAYRFHEKYPQVRFFEIDLPATSADKQQRVKKILGKTPDWVTFTPIDFNTQTLDEVLTKAGFAKNKKTFFVWEGVTYFISREAVQSTLDFIARNTAPGSRVVFDYMLEDVVSGADYSPYGSRRTVFFVSTRSEPYVFGLQPRYFETFVQQRGLKALSDLGPAQLSDRYLIDSQGKPRGKIAEFLRIAEVEVPPPVERQALINRATGKPVSAINTSLQHRVPIPDDVQALLDRHTQFFKAKDLDAVMTNYSDRYSNNGRRKDMVESFIANAFRRADFDHFQVVVTRFKQEGDRARIDGFVDRKAFRSPLVITHIRKEADGKWRWYGNQR